MRANQQNKKSKKGLTFNALEMIETNSASISDSIDKLSSLIGKMNVKVNQQEFQYRPRIYKGRNRGHGNTQDNYRARERPYSRDHFQNDRCRGNYNRNYITNSRARIGSGNNFENKRKDRFDNRQSYLLGNFLLLEFDILI